jgi:probable biosynthetic protein (TIGR04099 family)
MNIALRIDQAGTDPYLGTDLTPVLLGMPHLALNGLSETWLLKELGHRHWLQLARMTGRAVPSFRDVQGHVVYAAFRSVAIAGADFGRAREHDILNIRTALSRISRTQILSRHTLDIDGLPIGEVTMVSVFVHRNGGSSNHSVARVEIDGLPAVEADNAYPGLPTRHRERRGLDSAAVPPAASKRWDFMPCPSQDFNGAGFLYFTSFPAFVDRAEWAIDPEIAREAVTRQREITYYANLDPGEAVALHLAGTARSADSWQHHCWIERLSDGMRLADIYTEKVTALPIAGR